MTPWYFKGRFYDLGFLREIGADLPNGLLNTRVRGASSDFVTAGRNIAEVGGNSSLHYISSSASYS
jgi:hypothetical protein